MTDTKPDGTTQLTSAIGLMSGTSLDGIDVAFVQTDGDETVLRGPSRVYPYEAAFRHRLSEALEIAKVIETRNERPGPLKTLEADLTDRHAEVVRRFAEDCGIDLQTVDVIGFHGQTVLHRPEKALTVQIGDGARLAREIGRPVVWDMRARDMEEGGQGAPLVPAYHQALAARLTDEFAALPVVFVNIGGISNVTYVDGEHDPIAFDSGPGNALIDQWLQREAGIPFDQNGRVASEGGVVSDMAERYLASPFFSKPYPKSLDRFDFPVPPPGAGDLSDIARTLCYVTAKSIALAKAQFPAEPKLWIVCGGGRHHPSIMADLSAEAGAEARVVPAEACGLDGDAMEAEAWAYLAVRSMKGLLLTYPTTTGCRAAVSGGVLSPPDQ